MKLSNVNLLVYRAFLFISFLTEFSKIHQFHSSYLRKYIYLNVSFVIILKVIIILVIFIQFIILDFFFFCVKIQFERFLTIFIIGNPISEICNHSPNIIYNNLYVFYLSNLFEFSVYVCTRLTECKLKKIAVEKYVLNQN